MDVAALTAPGRIKTETYEIEGVGTITVRGMSRWELLEAGRIGEQHGAAAQEKFILACCMVDPAMTEADVRAWQNNSPAGELAPLQKIINRLSHLGKDAQKSDLPGDGERSGD